MKKDIFSAKQMEEFAMLLAKNAKKGQIYCLCGDLGAGKTVFVKAFAKGLNIKEEVTSPSFNIVNEYETPFFKLFHFDVYRINSIEELLYIGYEEYFFSDAICIIEWANIIKQLIPKDAIWINITKDINKGENYRNIEVI